VNTRVRCGLSRAGLARGICIGVTTLLFSSIPVAALGSSFVESAHLAAIFTSNRDFSPYMGLQLSGDQMVGKTITAKLVIEGTRFDGTQLKYQWYRDGKLIDGATKTKTLKSSADLQATYKLQAADKGKKISCKVTLQKAGYNNKVLQADANETVRAAGTSQKKTLPWVRPWATIGGMVGETAQVLELGTGNNYEWNSLPLNTKVTYTYQWYRNGKRISGATNSTYTFKTTDVGKDVTVAVTYHAPGYQDNTFVNADAADLARYRSEGITTAIAPYFEKYPGFNRCRYFFTEKTNTWTAECDQTVFAADEKVAVETDKSKPCGVFERTPSELQAAMERYSDAKPADFKYVYRCTQKS